MRGLAPFRCAGYLPGYGSSSAPTRSSCNYVNPMAMNCWAISRGHPSIKTVGLCHSVQGTASSSPRHRRSRSTRSTTSPPASTTWRSTSRFERNGEDLYPRSARSSAEGRVPRLTTGSATRCCAARLFRHRDRASISPNTRPGSSRRPRRSDRALRHPARRVSAPLREPDRPLEELRADYESDTPIDVKASHEYAATIINAHGTGEPSVIYGNVPNTGLITNLAGGRCVEVPCWSTRTASSRPYRRVAAAARGADADQHQCPGTDGRSAADREPRAFYHAAMMDPHTAAELDLDQSGPWSTTSSPPTATCFQLSHNAQSAVRTAPSPFVRRRGTCVVQTDVCPEVRGHSGYWPTSCVAGNRARAHFTDGRRNQ